MPKPTVILTVLSCFFVSFATFANAQSPAEEMSRVGKVEPPRSTILETASICSDISKVSSDTSYKDLIDYGWTHAANDEAPSPDFSKAGSRVTFLKDGILLIVGNTNGIRFCRLTAMAPSEADSAAIFRSVAASLSLKNLEESGEVIPLLQRRPNIIKKNHWYNRTNIVRTRFEQSPQDDTVGLFDILILPFD